MTVYIQTKQISKRKHSLETYPYELEKQPDTLRQLIRMLVSDGVSSYNKRIQNKEAMTVLTREDVDDMTQLGRIGFGIPFGNREADPAEAMETAIRGFEDGLYRMFVGEQEAESLDMPLCLHDGDTITVIRLVMLTGGYF